MTQSPAVAFVLNGREVSVAASADTPLLYLLRNHFRLVAAKFGCGQGLCGACFVLVDGVPVPSCDTPLEAVEGKSLTTLEGLSDADNGIHPLQAAFIRNQAAQCGYCTAGIIISAAALLDRNPHPSPEDVKAALDRHLCRCGAHQRMVDAVMDAAAAAQAR